MRLVSNPSTFSNATELGMGFHFARLVNKNEISSDGADATIINSVLAISKHELFKEVHVVELGGLLSHIEAVLSLQRLQGLDIKEVFPRLISGYQIAEYEVEDDPKAFLRFVDSHNSAVEQKYNERRLHQSPPFDRTSRATNVMYRYTILRNDPRIGPNGEVSPGTYATTSSDAAFVASGFGAVGRYALPALLPRCYKFKIVPPDGAPIKVGACQPNFGQAGGGVEVEFTTALPAGSAAFDASIPEF
ncbi:MAG: hypothetical protein WB816_11040 [Methylocystis sp.]